MTSACSFSDWKSDFSSELHRGLNRWRSQPKIFWGAKMFDFKQITPFCLRYRLSKHTFTIYAKNFGGEWHRSLPGYAYGLNQFFLRFRFGDRKKILRDRLEEFERPFSIDVISGHYILRDRWRNLRDRFGSSKHLKKTLGSIMFFFCSISA